MQLYRTKTEPLTPHTIKFPFKGITAPVGYILSPEQCLATGDYRDISPTPEDGYQLGTMATWDEVEGTVMMDVVAIPAPTAEEITSIRNQAIVAISNAAKSYVEDSANAGLQDELREFERVNGPNQMCTDIFNWGRRIYKEAEIRKSMVQAGLCDDGDYMSLLDFSAFGNKPYSVHELWIAGIVTMDEVVLPI